ncbi:hypothetical protein [Candidatus Phytoplasma fabacearum]|uniref:hypothetical protein n=1 Tax=Candidatus Phytoplasma fabacearum TaxID=2982628 RepID=UPI0030EAB9C2
MEEDDDTIVVEAINEFVKTHIEEQTICLESVMELAAQIFFEEQTTRDAELRAMTVDESLDPEGMEQLDQVILQSVKEAV